MRIWICSLLLVLACGETEAPTDAAGDAQVDAPVARDGGRDAPASDAIEIDSSAPEDSGADVQSPLSDAGADTARDMREVPLCVDLPETEVGTIPNFNIPRALAVTAEGFVHATSTTAAFGALPFHSNGSGSWETELLSDDSFSYRAGSITIVPRDGGSVYLLGIGIATNGSGVWEYEVPGGSNMALDASGAIHFTEDTNLVSYETGVAVESDMGSLPCTPIVIDDAGFAHMGHCERVGPRNFELTHVVEDGSGGFERTVLGEIAGAEPFIAAATHPHFVIQRDGSFVHLRIVDGTIEENALPDTDAVQAVTAHGGAVHVLQGHFRRGVAHTTGSLGDYALSRLNDSFIEGLAAIHVDDLGRVHIAHQGQYVGAKRIYYQRLCP